MVWSEYGCPVDLYTERPLKDWQAHVAILRGRNKQREKQSDKAEKESKKAKQTR